MANEVSKNIAEYMNSHSPEKQFNKYEVSTIAWAIRTELDRRKAEGLVLNTRTKKDKAILNQRVAAVANERLNPAKPLTGEDIVLYKRCWEMEYQDRTGKCAWGFPSIRQKLGYDPVTGREIAV